MGKYTPKQFSPHIYPEWGELIADLPPEKAQEIFMAICQYPHLNPEGGIWRFIKSQIDKDYNEFIERNKAHQDAIQDYWNNKKTTKENKGEQKRTNDNKCITKENKGEPITNNININEEHKQIKLHSSAKKFAERLREIVCRQKDICVDGQKLAGWAKSFDLLMRKDGVSEERISAMLEWYSENAGGDYVPVAESGASFREKFLKLESAKLRIQPKQKQHQIGDWL